MWRWLNFEAEAASVTRLGSMRTGVAVDAIEGVAEVGLGPADGESVGAGTDLDGPVAADSAGDPLRIPVPGERRPQALSRRADPGSPPV
jgi:hypothetical protein